MSRYLNEETLMGLSPDATPEGIRSELQKMRDGGYMEVVERYEVGKATFQELCDAGAKMREAA